MIGTFKEVTEMSKTRFADSPLGKKLEGKEIDNIDLDLDSSLDAYVDDAPADVSDENGKQYNTEMKGLLPNNTYVFNDVTYKTDDNGKIHMVYNSETRSYELLPDNSYEINGYKYQTDCQGRIVSAEGMLRLKNEKRDVINTDVKDMKEGDERGHIIADQFGGSNHIDNLVAMGFDVNRRDYKKFENMCAKEISAGKDVNVSVKLDYDDKTARPSKFTVSYTIDGEQFERRFINYTKGENNNA